MKKLYSIKLLLSALLLAIGCNAWGVEGDEVAKIDLTTQEFSSNNYSNECTVGDWKVMGTNNNKAWAYFRIGGKASTSGTLVNLDRTITGTVALDSPVKQIKIRHNGFGGKNATAVAAFNLVSIDVEVSSKSDLSSSTKTTFSSFSTFDNSDVNTGAGTEILTPSTAWEANKYYRITLHCTMSNTNNCGLDVYDVVFIEAGGGDTPSTPTALSAPSNLQSSNVTTTSATLSWDAVEHASSYTVKIGETEHTGLNTNSYSATGLTAGTRYTWTVKAVGDGTNYTTSAYAANANFTTEAEQGGGDVKTAELPLSFSGYQEKSDWTFNADWSSSTVTSTSAYYKLLSDKSISSPKMTFGDNAFVRFTVNMRTTGGVSGNSNKLDIYFNTTLIGTITATSNELANYTLDLTGTSIPSGEGVLTFKSETTDGAKGLGVRSISIEAVTQPLLECASSVTLDYNTTNGEIPYSITNPDGSTLTTKVNAEATWISNVTVDALNSKVTFDTEVNNTGVKRDATITLTYGTIQKEVVVTQNRQIFDYAVLPFNVAAGTSSADLKEMDGVTYKVDGTDYKNNTHKVKLSANTHYVQVKTNERIGVCSFSFCGLADKGSSSFKLQESVNGTEWTDVESFTVTFAKKNDVVIWTSTKSFSNNARYAKLAFLKKDGEVNCGLGEFSIAKYVVPTNLEIEIKSFATDGELYYATFSSEYAWVVPGDLIVSEATIIDGVLAFDSYKTTDVVPANTGVLISALEAGTYTVDVEADEDILALAESVLGKDNMLHPASEDKEELKANHKFYMLARDANGENIGFYYGAADGGEFTSREGSAYLAVPTSASTPAPARFIFGQRGVSTDLLNVNDNNQSTKVLRDGRLYIIREGKTYDSFGRLVK